MGTPHPILYGRHISIIRYVAGRMVVRATISRCPESVGIQTRNEIGDFLQILSTQMSKSLIFKLLLLAFFENELGRLSLFNMFMKSC